MQTPNARSRLLSPGRLAIVAAALLVACDDHDVVGPAGSGANASHQAPYAGPSRFSLTFDGVSSVANTADDALAATETDNIQLEASFNWAGSTSAPAQVVPYNGNLFASGWGIFVDQATGRIAVGGASASYLVNRESGIGNREWGDPADG